MQASQRRLRRGVWPPNSVLLTMTSTPGWEWPAHNDEGKTMSLRVALWKQDGWISMCFEMVNPPAEVQLHILQMTSIPHFAHWHRLCTLHGVHCEATTFRPMSATVRRSNTREPLMAEHRFIHMFRDHFQPGCLCRSPADMLFEWSGGPHDERMTVTLETL